MKPEPCLRASGPMAQNSAGGWAATGTSWSTGLGLSSVFFGPQPLAARLGDKC